MEEMNLFGGMFGKVAPGMCRLSMNGDIAVKTSGGYKSYNVSTGRLTNCSSFVFDVCDDLFFVIPAKKASEGDIILVGGKPKCVLKNENDIITVINYEDSTIENIIPERQMFLGDAYFFGKIVSVFGSGKSKGKKGMSKIMKYMMLSEMMKGSSRTMNPMLVMAMAGGGMNDMFDFEDMEGEDE
ncbi:MAG: hypothetical protein J5999_03535 [Oscillospiraceae bacterium]|nr:hypothetical protein [Oscillospiraceae bacterium]